MHFESAWGQSSPDGRTEYWNAVLCSPVRAALAHALSKCINAALPPQIEWKAHPQLSGRLADFVCDAVLSECESTRPLNPRTQTSPRGQFAPGSALALTS